MNTPRLPPQADLFPDLAPPAQAKIPRRPTLQEVANPTAKSAGKSLPVPKISSTPPSEPPQPPEFSSGGGEPDPEPAPQPTAPPAKKSWKKRTWWSWIWFWTQAALLFCLIFGVGAGYFLYQKALVYAARAEKYDLNKLNDISVTSTFTDVHGEELGRIFIEDRIILSHDQIPDIMRHALLSAEDRRFYEHGAIDYKGIGRALFQDIIEHRRVMQGASTLEQQMAKHVIGDFSRSVDRKLTEAFVAMRLEHTFTKDQILDYYMNRVYFGNGYFGVGAAARGYFGKEAKDLTIPECALLAGIIRAPTSSSPRLTPPKRALTRRNFTLKQMLDEGYINHDEFDAAMKTPLVVLKSKPSGLQSYVMGAAIKEMEQILSIDSTEEMPQGLTIRTNIDLSLQRQIEQSLNSKLTALETPTEATAAVTAPMSAVIPPNKPELQYSVLLAEPDTGRVHVYIGGRNFAKSQYDHVTQAKRESGAVLQPILYGIAFDQLKLNPASMINASFLDPASPASDADMELGDPQKDVSKRFLTVQDALALGNHAAATRVGLKLGPTEVTEWLHRAGLVQANVSHDQPNTFIPDPMSLSDLVNLYEILANNGTPKKLKIIRSIQSRTGEVLYDDEVRTNTHELLPPILAQQMSLTLERAFRSGPYKQLFQSLGLTGPVAGMPGHSDGYRDLWFVGYHPNWIGGLWIGYDDAKPIGSKDKVESLAPQSWAEIVQMAQRTNPTQNQDTFAVPGDLSKVEINRSNGALSGLAGLAPQPGDIFVYLKKDQIASIGQDAPTPQQRLANPRDWSDWLSSMFNQADETQATQDSFLSDDRRGTTIPTLAQYKMPGLRGNIISADGVVYATMTTSKNLVLGWPATDQATQNTDVVAWMRDRINQLETALGVHTSISDLDLQNGFELRRFQPYTVLENISADQIKKVEEAGLLKKGYSLQTVPIRFYPKGTELAHLIGHLAGDQKRNKGRYLSGDIIYDRYRGATGLEKVFNDDLIGKDGEFEVSTTPDGYAKSAAVVTPSTIGNTVRLTIDSKLQAAAQYAVTQRLLRDPNNLDNFTQVTDPQHRGAILIEDISNGNIVTFVSNPSFDPNLFVPTISQDNWKALNEDPGAPLLCRAYQAEYPPGSTFKTITSVAAMRAGVFDPDWTVNCLGILDVAGFQFKFPHEKGPVQYDEALKHSYNTYFMTLGLKVGRDILLDTARTFGLGASTQVILPEEHVGLLPDPEFVRRVHGREFGPGDVANTSIGQGDVLVTPLQLLGVATALANGGTIYKPRLVQSVEDANGNVVREIPAEVTHSVTLDSKYMANMKTAMIGVVEDGTAGRVQRDDMQIAAKTGTAQVGSKTEPRQIAWLMGYLPADHPKYSFVFMVEGEKKDNATTDEEGGLLGGRDAGVMAQTYFDVLYPKPEKEQEAEKKKAAAEAATAAKDKSAAATSTSTNATPSTNAAPAPKAVPAAPEEHN